MASLQLDRNLFFPGNIVTGRVFGGMGGGSTVVFTCELFQHWTTTSTQYYNVQVGNQTQRRSRTVTHHHRRLTPIANMMIPVNPDGSFGFQLDYGCIPSLPIEKCTIRYYLNAVVNGATSPPVPFTVLAPMQAAQWQANTSRQEERSFDITCCCCCDKGKIHARFFMAKTALALDRDQVCVNAEIDATQCESDVDNFIVMLNCTGRVKIAQPLTFTSSAGLVKVPCNIKAGEKKTVQAIVPLNPTAAPSFNSAVVDIAYNIRCHLDISWAEDVAANFECFVAHSVDPNSFNFQQAWQTTNFYSGQGQQMVYQPPTGQPVFDMAPPPTFATLPPPEFKTFQQGDIDEDGVDDG